MTHKWNYGDAYLRHPIERGKAVFTDGSCLMVNNIFSPLPDFMRQADLLFVDPPWNKGNMTSFYTKADMMPPAETYEDFYARLFACIKEISPDVCYLEIGKEHLADFVVEMRKLYKKVTFYNSSYYHKRDNRCYVVRGWKRGKPPRLDDMDEEDIIEWVCQHETYQCIGDLCMGRGLVAVNAYKSGRPFVGTELNHKRLSVSIEYLAKLGAKYEIEGA